MAFHFKKPKFFSGFPIIAVLFLAFGLGLFVVSSQQKQDNRSQAATCGTKGCCSNISGAVCKTTSSGCAGGFVDDYCPGAESYKCCMPTTTSCYRNLGGRCLSVNARFDKCTQGSFRSGYCPGGDDVKCCVLPAPTATPVPPTKTPTPTPTKTPTPTPTKTPTPTPAPNSTTLLIDLLFHGIGKGGDNRNPNGGGNANPIHPTRSVVIDVYDLDNNLIVTKQGDVTFDPVSGSYKGTIIMGTMLNTQPYVIKAKLSHSLRGNMSRQIVKGTTNVLPVIKLVNGDTNNDAKLDIEDYNIILGCYSDFDLPAADCNVSKRVMADIDDDGNVNQFDMNLFLREMSVQEL
jgi:hypothetical protein